MRWLSERRRLYPVALTLLTSVVSWGAPITVTPTVTTNGSVFHYNYSVINGSGMDLAVLDVMVPVGAVITNLAAPSGFQRAYDSGLGLVSFLEDTAMFGTSAISGFAFDSPLASGATSFNATLIDANSNVSTTTGATTGPVTGTAVPEPGYLPLLALLTPLLAFKFKPAPFVRGLSTNELENTNAKLNL